MGTTVAVADPSSTGVVKVSVHGLTLPVPAPAGAPPLAAGSRLAAADITVCAGPSGSAQGPQLGFFVLVSKTGATIAPTPFTTTAPNLASTTSLAANQCARGNLTFTVPEGFTPRSVTYGPDTAHIYAWRAP
jgi:hypothetical protein